ncbi:MAG: ribonuclease P protein component [Mangrovibacterium sp.]
MSEFGLPKSSRLHSRKLIEELFEEGASSFVHPIKVVYKTSLFEDNEPVKAAFSVSKRNFKHAVDRNRYKRLLREAYRLNCQDLKKKMITQGSQLSIMFIYASKGHNDYASIEKSMRKILYKLSQCDS